MMPRLGRKSQEPGQGPDASVQDLEDSSTSAGLDSNSSECSQIQTRMIHGFMVKGG